jgi:hypothetical protein
MEPAFIAMAIGSGLHFLEEYVYPGGFLNWMRSVFPETAPGLVGAIIINVAFFALVLSPLLSDAQATPIFSLSVASLLLANGALHAAGTLLTGRYSPGVFTSVFCYFPAAIYALIAIPPKWHMDVLQVLLAILLGIVWQLIPLGLMVVRGRVRSGSKGRS